MMPKNLGDKPRFSDDMTFMRMPYRAKKKTDFVVVGLPFDSTSTDRTGSRYGPRAVRSASAFVWPYNYCQDIDIFETLTGTDIGDAPTSPGDTDASLKKMYDYIKPYGGSCVFGVGGEHTVMLPELMVAARRGKVVLVQLDAHPDTWDEYWGSQKYTHGTVVRRAFESGLLSQVIQVGIRGSGYEEDHNFALDNGFIQITSQDVRKMGVAGVARSIKELAWNDPVFLSVDMDFFDPAFAPGTGTPEVGGFSSYEGIEILRNLEGLNIVGGDVVELCPPYDQSDITAVLAANVLFEMISLLALRGK
jgi:agmatinase